MSVDLKYIVRGDYMTGPFGALVKCISPKVTHSELKTSPTALKLFAVARVLFSTLLAFVILVPLAIIAKPLIGVAICVALVMFVASAILNHKEYQNSISKSGTVLGAVTGFVKDANQPTKTT